MTDFTTEFQRESRRIDQLIWDAMSLVHGERVLFCGFTNDGQWVKRAIEIGVDVSVIESDSEKLAELQTLNIPTLRGSTTLIPARDESFDAIIAFHYLHEIDPTFHTQIVWELARVGKRIIIVEPAPPADALGKRIFELYSRAKYEAGAFEEYKPIDYWRKLLAMVKADVLMQQFTFTRLAPRFAVEETVKMMLSAMEVEAMPEAYLDELREIARGPEAQLSPLSRFVLVALAAGEPVRASAGTLFREDVLPEPVAAPMAPPPAVIPGVTLTPVTPPPAYAAALQGSEFPPVLPPTAAPQQPQQPPNPFTPQPFVPQQVQPAAAAPQPPAAPPAPAPQQPQPQQPQPFVPQQIAPAAAAPQQPPAPQQQPPAFAPQLPPQQQLSPQAPAPPPPAFGMPPAAGESPFGVPTSEPAFGMPDPAPFGAPPPERPSPFGTPFALADDPDPFGLSDDPEERAAFGWNWEPPEGTDSAHPGDVPFGR